MKLSIITPSYNQARFIGRTLDSVLKEQDYGNIEHLVVDGLSKDATVEVLKKYKAAYSDKLFYVSEKDSGQSDAINKGFRKATGDIIGWINSDDYYEANVFGFVMEYFKAHPAIDMIYGICHIVDENGVFLKDCESTYAFQKCRIDYKEFKYSNLIDVFSGLIPQPAVFFRRSVFEKTGYLDESLNFVMDYELWLRIGKIGTIKRVEKLLAYFRTHEEAKTTFRNTFGYIFEALRARRKNGGRPFSRFHLYVGYTGTKAFGRMVLTRLGVLRKKSGTLKG